MDRPQGPRTGWRPIPHRNPRAFAATAAAAVLVSSLIGFLNSQCLDLVVASSNEKFQLLTDIAKDYKATVDRRCVKVQIIQKASGSAERALRRDWIGERQPRPDVWSPAARTWLSVLSQDRTADGKEDILPASAQSLMQSPLVIAMPEDMANALSATNRIAWQQVFALAQDPRGWALYDRPWGAFKLGKTDPRISTSGLHALISVNFVAEQKDERTEFLRKIESSVVHYGDSVGTFLYNLRLAADSGNPLEYVSAIAVEEKQVHDYNRGNPRSGSCTPTCEFPPPRQRLRAMYPTEGTLVADHPFAILKWASEAHRQAAADFEVYLESDAVQRRFQDAGFRNHLREPGPVLQPPYFDPRGAGTRWEPPTRIELAEMIGLWSREYRKPAHGLFVMDVGRSMAEASGEGPATKLDVAVRAAVDALAELVTRDEIGLWSFPTTDGSPYREISPPSTASDNTRALVSKLKALGSLGDEATFYATVRASVDRVRASFAADRINAVVVLTGGGFAIGDNAAQDALIEYLRSQPKPERVPVFVIAYGRTEPKVLTKIVEASGGGFYDATDVVNTSLSELLRNAMSNF